ncbi:hypothetical protein, partial [Xenorhabdus szentirmaii]
MVIRTLDGLLGADAKIYNELTNILAKGQGPGTPFWQFYESGFIQELNSIYDAFNRGIYIYGP